MVDDQQIAVADGVGTVFGLALAVAVAGVAGDAAVAHPCGAQSLAWCLLEGVEVLEEVLAGVEVFFHACHILNSRGGGRITGFLGGAEQSAGIPLVGAEHVVGLAEHFLARHQGTQVAAFVVAVGTSG